jgi:hypothetical protein
MLGCRQNSAEAGIQLLAKHLQPGFPDFELRRHPPLRIHLSFISAPATAPRHTVPIVSYGRI